MIYINGKALPLSGAVRYLRAVRAKMTTKDFAKFTKISSKTLCDIEHGRITKPHSKTLIQIARVCGEDENILLDYLDDLDEINDEIK
jgi:transcriptional regulator with XRE-family HTH domain